MARRRRAALGQAISRAGDNIGQIFISRIMADYQDRLIRQRQIEDDARTRERTLLSGVMEGKVRPDAAASIAPGFDFSPFAPSQEKLAGPAVERINSAKNVADMPSLQGTMSDLQAGGV